MRRTTLVRLLGSASSVALVFLLVKFFVADVYRIETGSMRPTLFGGRDRPDAEPVHERVLVRFRRAWEPQRFDIAVLRDPEGGPPLVKRAVGLPGEALVVRDGDLCIGPQASRLPPDSLRPAPIPVFDQRWHDVGALFATRGRGSAEPDGESWRLSPADDEALWLEYHPALLDDYLDLEHRRVEGVVEVNDAVLELEISFDDAAPGARWWLFVTEEADRFVLEAELQADGLELELRRDPQPGSEVAATDGFDLRERMKLPTGTPVRVSLANVDNVVRARLEAEGLPRCRLETSYPGNRAWPGAAGAPRHQGARAGFGARGGSVRVRGVRLARDLYYTAGGTVGTSGPVYLGPDEVFLLGDNSSVSSDSRHFGPVALADLLGTAELVVWPRFRRLVPAEEP